LGSGINPTKFEQNDFLSLFACYGAKFAIFRRTHSSLRAIAGEALNPQTVVADENLTLSKPRSSEGHSQLHPFPIGVEFLP
jgi:hypothetical protein